MYTESTLHCFAGNMGMPVVGQRGSKNSCAKWPWAFLIFSAAIYCRNMLSTRSHKMCNLSLVALELYSRPRLVLPSVSVKNPLKLELW